MEVSIVFRDVLVSVFVRLSGVVYEVTNKHHWFIIGNKCYEMCQGLLMREGKLMRQQQNLAFWMIQEIVLSDLTFKKLFLVEIISNYFQSNQFSCKIYVFTRGQLLRNSKKVCVIPKSMYNFKENVIFSSFQSFYGKNKSQLKGNVKKRTPWRKTLLDNGSFNRTSFKWLKYR